MAATPPGPTPAPTPAPAATPVATPVPTAAPAPVDKAAVRSARAKIATIAAIASVLGSCVLGSSLIYMVHQEGTPAGQANLKEREETRRFNKQKDVELEQIKLQRAQLEAAQAAKEN